MSKASSRGLEFDSNRSRVTHCPCGKSNEDNKFSPFIGYDEFGYCFGCDTTFYPKGDSKIFYQKHVRQESVASYINPEFVKQSAGNYRYNVFVQFIAKLTGLETVNKLISEYCVGTPNEPGKRDYVIFWLIDKDRKVRSGKWMLYELIKNSESCIGIDCKRVKRLGWSILWEHKQKKLLNFNFQTCLFGEHLLKKYPDKLVAIVESEKTALISAAYFPDFVWLATGGKSGLKISTCAVLRDRKVILFPDINGYDEWNRFANDLRTKFEGFQVSVSNLLKELPSDTVRCTGYDIADYLIQFKPDEL